MTNTISHHTPTEYAAFCATAEQILISPPLDFDHRRFVRGYASYRLWYRLNQVPYRFIPYVIGIIGMLWSVFMIWVGALAGLPFTVLILAMAGLLWYRMQNGDHASTYFLHTLQNTK